MKTSVSFRMVSVALLATGAAVTLGTSGCSTDGGEPGVKPSASELEGTWTGHGTFEQELGGKTARVDIVVNLSFDGRGFSDVLPSLGVLSPWRLYVVSQPGAAPDDWNGEALQQGGTIYVFCPFEADGSANQVQVVSNGDVFDVSHREYLATYRFADLLTYELYDYDKPGAPQATVTAVDSYRLSGEGAGQRLLVTGRGSGTVSSGSQPIQLRFDAKLERGRSDNPSSSCRLGPPTASE